ncbi:hypothetical protein FB451DRAFT_1189920 [Mycena latifolia]|nr:hypothetical protein FB451DRAFT_1189920 [Mycena latifolia]
MCSNSQRGAAQVETGISRGTEHPGSRDRRNPNRGPAGYTRIYEILRGRGAGSGFQGSARAASRPGPFSTTAIVHAALFASDLDALPAPTSYACPDSTTTTTSCCSPTATRSATAPRAGTPHRRPSSRIPQASPASVAPRVRPTLIRGRPAFSRASARAVRPSLAAKRQAAADGSMYMRGSAHRCLASFLLYFPARRFQRGDVIRPWRAMR